MADTSKQFYLVNPTPGVFYTDDPYANPYPHTLRGYDPNKWETMDAGSGRDIKETNAPFMLGAWNANGDLDKNDQAWHMAYGRREAHNLDAPNKKWNNYYGWGNLFSAVNHSVYRGGSDNNGAHPNLELYTQREMTESQGVLLGSRYIADAHKCTARWMSPVGIQFKWHNLYTKANATGMKIYNLFLIYHDLWAPDRILYAPIVGWGDKTNPGRTYTRGVDILSDDGKITGGDSGGHATGEFVGFVDPNSMDVIMDKYTVSACIGLYIDMRITKYDGAIYDKVFDFWDFKFLFDQRENQSMIVYPKPHNLKERMEGGSVKLL